MTTEWKFTNATGRVVSRILNDGTVESMLASALPAGVVPLPADSPPPPSQEELDIAAVCAYAKLNALKGMTPSQVQAWVDANVTDLASARDAIKTLAVAVSILARRL